jgi:hypothetical protein
VAATKVVLPIPNRPPIALPPGVTAADQRAAEAAANAWWLAFDAQTLAIPNNDPSKILAFAVPGKPAGPLMVKELEKIRAENIVSQRLVPGTIRQQRINDTKFLAPTVVSVEICLANNDYYADASGTRYNEGLAASSFVTIVEKTPNGWLVSDYGRIRQEEDGKSCEI